MVQGNPQARSQVPTTGARYVWQGPKCGREYMRGLGSEARSVIHREDGHIRYVYNATKGQRCW